MTEHGPGARQDRGRGGARLATATEHAAGRLDGLRVLTVSNAA
jgi:hypothetical protein